MIPGHVHPSLLAPLNERVTAVETQLRELVEQLGPILAAAPPAAAPAQVALALDPAAALVADGRVTTAELLIPLRDDRAGLGDDKWIGLAVDAWVFAAADVGGIEYGQVVALDAKTVTVKTGRHGTVIVPNVPSRVWPAPEGFGS